MIQKSCSEKSVLNTRDVTHTAINFSGKSKCREFVIRFESGNQRVMNQKGETKNDNHYDHQNE